MPKLNQYVALVAQQKSVANKLTAPLFHSIGQTRLFAGLTQTYRRAFEDGVVYPDDNTEVQLTVAEVLRHFETPNARLLDLQATVETANMAASADVKVGDQTIIANAPVTFLMQFEKFLEQEVRGLVTKLPVLDPAHEWVPSTSARVGIMETAPFETIKTAKVQKPIVLYEATEKHPAQTQLVTQDVVEGYWVKKNFAGAISAADRDAIIERLETLIAAVKVAREAANDREAEIQSVGPAVFSYLWGR